MYFFGVSLLFCQEANATPVTPTHIYRKYNISMRFLIKIIFSHFLPKEKIYFLEKRNTIFPDITKNIVFRREFFWKDHLFRTFEENIIFPGIFFEKDHLSFSVKRIRSYFRKKKSPFLIIQERSYSSEIFLERPSFQNIRKKKIWCFMQC